MVEDPETYLSWNDDGIVLICERSQCGVVKHGSRFFYTQDLPQKLLPETAVLIRAKHLATHTEV